MHRPAAEKVLRVIVVSAFLAWLFLAFAHPDSAFDQDLARHLAMGRMIWTSGSVPTTNLFTYTNPSFPFLDHHWLGQVAFYLADSAFGTVSLALLTVALGLGAFLLAFRTAERTGGFAAAAVSAAAFLPVLFERTDARPEMFGYLFLALVLLLLFSGDARAKRWRWVAPLVMAVWVNTHISFVYGALAVAAYVASELWRLAREPGARTRFLSPLLFGAASAAALFVNPRGAAGAFYPFTIFSNYGYRIVENQSIFFLIPCIHDPVLSYFSYCLLPLLALVLAFVAVRALRSRGAFRALEPREAALVLVFLVSLGLAVWAIRNFPNAALAGIPALALLLARAFPRALGREVSLRRFAFAEGAVFASALVALGGSFAIASAHAPSLAVREDYKGGVDFLLARRLPGNIFNDFDIGGYLDGRIYPEYRTFVDDRPEAFPASFFSTYIAIQQDPAVRAEEFSKYGVNTVVFSVNDATPWAQDFLRQITEDPGWKTVYYDGFTIVLTRATAR